MKSVPYRGSEWVLTMHSMHGPSRYRGVVSSFALRLRGCRSLLVLGVQPGLEWREVVDDGSGVHLILTGHRLECFWPGFAQTHRQHLLQFLSNLFVAIDRT